MKKLKKTVKYEINFMFLTSCLTFSSVFILFIKVEDKNLNISSFECVIISWSTLKYKNIREADKQLSHEI